MNKGLIGGAALAVGLVLAQPALAQLPALRDRPLSAAERGRLTSLESELQRISSQRNTSVAAVRAIAAALGERLVTGSPDQLLRAIDERAQALVVARGRISQLERELQSLDSLRLQQAVAPLLSAAGAALDAGDIPGAEARLLEAESRFDEARESMQARADRFAARQSEITAQRAAVRAVVFDYAGAAELYAQAAERAPASETSLRWRHRLSEVEALDRGASQRADAAAAQQAMQVLQTQVMPLTSRAERPGEWAETQATLGRLLSAARRREAGVAQVSPETLLALRNAAAVSPPSVSTAVHVENRRLLGATLEQSGDGQQADEGLAILRTLAAEAPSDRSVQFSLARALSNASDRRRQPALAEEGAAVLRRLLTPQARSENPAAWATTQYTLAIALGELAALRRTEAAYREALAAAEAAVEATPRETFPAERRRRRLYVAHLLGKISELNGPTAPQDFARAMAMREDVLADMPATYDPAFWSSIQQEIGVAYGRRGAELNDLAMLRRSADAYRAALTVVTRERAPRPWAFAQQGLGDTLLHMAERSEGGERARLTAEARVVLVPALEVAREIQHAPLVAEIESYLRRADALSSVAPAAATASR